MKRILVNVAGLLSRALLLWQMVFTSLFKRLYIPAIPCTFGLTWATSVVTIGERLFGLWLLYFKLESKLQTVSETVCKTGYRRFSATVGFTPVRRTEEQFAG